MNFMRCQELDRFFPAVKIMVFGVKQYVDNTIQIALTIAFNKLQNLNI